MPKRKINHKKHIIAEAVTTVDTVEPADIIHFKYITTTSDDETPLVFVLPERGKRGVSVDVKLGDVSVINGINLNYLEYYKVEHLLKEKNLKKMSRYVLYKDAYRSYSTKKMRNIKLVTHNIMVTDTSNDD
jgi:hypothetical protein